MSPTTGGTQFNSKSPTVKRILKEASELAHHPSGEYAASPLEDNLFEWHFTLRGPPEPSPYAKGLYHGRIVLPADYPLKPPAFRFLTPTGRFEVNREICLSISGHHEELWQPAWGIRTALIAIRSFMDSDPKGQVGGLECDDAARRRMANESRKWACRACGKSNEEIINEAEGQAESSGASAGESTGPKTTLPPSSSENTATEKGARASVQAQSDIDGVPPELRLAYRDEMQPGSTSSAGPEGYAREEEKMHASEVRSMAQTGTLLPISTTSDTPPPSKISPSTISSSTAPAQVPLPVQPAPVTSSSSSSSPSSLSAPRPAPATTTAASSSSHPETTAPAARPAHAVPLQPTPTSSHPHPVPESHPSSSAPGPAPGPTSSSVFPSLSSSTSSSPQPNIPVQAQTQHPSQQQTTAQTPSQVQSARRIPDNRPVPDWLDRAIYGVAAALIFMVVKKLLFL